MKVSTYYVKKNNAVEKKKLVSLLARGTDFLIGKTILQVNFRMGSYGMGGPGFFGLLLDFPNGKSEWMVFTIWAATWSMLFDSHWVGAHPVFYEKQRPLKSDIYSDGKLLEWDDLTPQIINGKIIDAALSDKAFILKIELNGKTHTLELLDEDVRLPAMPDGSARKTIKREERIGGYIVFHENDGFIDSVENKT